MTDRVVLLIDMDCFYVQVEQQLKPETLGKPAVVVQYNTWKGGGIIAVNYEARACGVRRNMRGDEARRLCPDLLLFRVPERRGKADIGHYREAGRRVIDALRPFADRVERASVDEAYVEVTAEAARRAAHAPVTADQLANTFVVGFGGEEKTEECRRGGVEAFLESLQSGLASDGDRLLAAGAAICEQMRQAVLDKTGYRCSAGIAHNKVLAKLCAGRNKPNRQTILPHGSVPQLYETLPIKKVRFLGGKLGDAVTEGLDCETMADLSRLSLAQLQAALDAKTGLWLHQLSRGFDSEPVADRHLPKSIGCSKNFRGPEVLRTVHKVRHWLTQLATEASERLTRDQQTNQRTSRSLTVSVTTEDGRHISRACALTGYAAETIAADAYAALAKLNTAQDGDQAWTPALINLSISAGKFSEAPSAACGNIADMFSRLPSTSSGSGSGSRAAGSRQLTNSTAAASSSSSARETVEAGSDSVAFDTDGAKVAENGASDAVVTGEENAEGQESGGAVSGDKRTSGRTVDEGCWLGRESVGGGGEKRRSEDEDDQPSSKSARSDAEGPSAENSAAASSAAGHVRPAAGTSPVITGFFARKERQIRAEMQAAAAAAPTAPAPLAASSASAVAAAAVSDSTRRASPDREKKATGSPARSASRGASSPVRRGRGRGGASASRRGRRRGSRGSVTAASPDRRRARPTATTASGEDPLDLDENSVDADTLAALPEDIRREVEDQLERQRKRKEEEATQARSGIRRYLRTATPASTPLAAASSPAPVAAAEAAVPSGASTDAAAATAGKTAESCGGPHSAGGDAPAVVTASDCGVDDAVETPVADAHGRSVRSDSPPAVPLSPVAGPSGLCRSAGGTESVASSEPPSSGEPSVQQSDPVEPSDSTSDAAAPSTATSAVASAPDNGQNSTERVSAPTPDTAPCPHCGQPVSPWELPEHLDYHMALELSKQVTPPQARPQTRAPVRGRAPTSRKRGRPSKAETLRKAGEVRRIDVFFKQ